MSSRPVSFHFFPDLDLIFHEVARILPREVRLVTGDRSKESRPRSLRARNRPARTTLLLCISIPQVRSAAGSRGGIIGFLLAEFRAIHGMDGWHGTPRNFPPWHTLPGNGKSSLKKQRKIRICQGLSERLILSYLPADSPDDNPIQLTIPEAPMCSGTQQDRPERDTCPVP